MRAGSLDRRVTVESFTTTADAAGEPIKTWSTFVTFWASRRDVRGWERFNGSQEIATRTAVYRSRWVAGIHERMRVVDAGTTYRIVGIADDERRNWLELTVEAIDPEAIA